MSALSAGYPGGQATSGTNSQRIPISTTDRAEAWLARQLASPISFGVVDRDARHVATLLSGWRGTPDDVRIRADDAPFEPTPLAAPSFRLPASNSLMTMRASARKLAHTTASTVPGRALDPRVLALASVVKPIAARHNVDSALLMAIIQVESRGDPHARSPRGAVGLMQVMPTTGAQYGAHDLRDKTVNITAGTRHLRSMMDQFQDRHLAIAAYNAGGGAVRRHGKRVPPYPETQRYVREVLAYYSVFRERYA